MANNQNKTNNLAIKITNLLKGLDYNTANTVLKQTKQIIKHTAILPK